MSEDKNDVLVQSQFEKIPIEFIPNWEFAAPKIFTVLPVSPAQSDSGLILESIIVEQEPTNVHEMPLESHIII